MFSTSLKSLVGVKILTTLIWQKKQVCFDIHLHVHVISCLEGLEATVLLYIDEALLHVHVGVLGIRDNWASSAFRDNSLGTFRDKG